MISESWKLVPVTVPAAEVAQVSFPGSSAQDVLHNRCVARLEELKLQCINSPMDRVRDIQIEYSATARLLGIIHEWDSDLVKKKFLKE